MESVLGESTQIPFYPLPCPQNIYIYIYYIRRIKANQKAVGGGVYYSCVMFMFCSACVFLFETESIVYIYTKEWRIFYVFGALG